MKFQKLALAVLGVVALTAATLTLTLNSNAQGDPSRGGRDSGFQGAGPQGFQGGPFSPECRTYTLANNGTSSIEWTAACSQP